MSASFYNPYESNNTQGMGESISEHLKGIFSPTNIAGAVLFNPTTFSISKGFRAPFSGFFRKDHWKGFGEDLKGLISSDRKLASTGSILGRVWNGIWKPQRFGGQATAAGTASNKASAVGKNAIKVYNEKIKQFQSNLPGRAKSIAESINRRMFAPGFYGTNASMSLEDLEKEVAKSLSSGRLGKNEIFNLSGRYFGKDAKWIKERLSDEFVKEVHSVGVASRRELSSIAKLNRTIGKGAAATWGRRLFKGSMFLGKATAWGMIAGIVLTTAAGLTEPIGRGIVGAADKALNAFNNRFMVETGGTLSAGFLSQGAATERQRAVQAISKAYINGRSALGQEAYFMHG